MGYYIVKECGIGKCHVCQKEIDSKDFECGHIQSVKEGGSTTSNLLYILFIRRLLKWFS